MQIPNMSSQNCKDPNILLKNVSLLQTQGNLTLSGPGERGDILPPPPRILAGSPAKTISASHLYKPVSYCTLNSDFDFLTLLVKFKSQNFRIL